MIELDLKLLPAQRKLVQSRDAWAPFVGGYGSGKTYASVVKSIVLGFENAPTPGIFVMPTFALIQDVAVRSFSEFLQEYGIPFTYKHNDHVLTVANTFDVLFRSGDRPEKIVGTNAGWGGMDEPAQMSEEVPKMLQARIRNPKAKLHQMFATGTPEGFNWFYEYCSKPGVNVIRARTAENPYLPPDYLKSLSARLSPQEIKAYLEGEFVSFDGAWYAAKPHVIFPIETLDGGIDVYYTPQQTSGQLVIGVDTGGGLDRDSSAITMTDKKDLKLVASWKDNKATIRQTVDRIQTLIKRFTTTTSPEFPGLYGHRGNPLPSVVVEVNGIGRATYQDCVERGISCSEVNTTEATRYKGLQEVRFLADEGGLAGPPELLHEANNLIVKDGKFKGPKDMSMAIGFAINHIRRAPYVKPPSERGATFNISDHLSGNGRGW